MRRDDARLEVSRRTRRDGAVNQRMGRNRPSSPLFPSRRHTARYDMSARRQSHPLTQPQPPPTLSPLDSYLTVTVSKHPPPPPQDNTTRRQVSNRQESAHNAPLAAHPFKPQTSPQKSTAPVSLTTRAHRRNHWHTSQRLAPRRPLLDQRLARQSSPSGLLPHTPLTRTVPERARERRQGVLCPVLQQTGASAQYLRVL